MIYDPRLGISDRGALPDRLQSYSRYVALVAEQLEAARAHDAGRLRELERERTSLGRELRDELERHPAPEDRLSTLLHDGLRQLDEQDDLQREERELWDHLQSGALRAAQALRSTAHRPGRYGELTGSDARVDVRF